MFIDIVKMKQDLYSANIPQPDKNDYSLCVEYEAVANLALTFH
jgi:hypothetical protein